MLLDAISSYAMCSSMLTKYHSAHSENRDRRMREVVPYKRLKTMENNSPSGPKSSLGRLQELVVY